MNPFNRLPGSRRAPSGLEWTVLKRIPCTLLLGSFVAACAILLFRAGWVGPGEAESMKAQYSIVGLWLSFVIITLTLALGCAIIVVMKGHAYVMDAYPLPDGDTPRKRKVPVPGMDGQRK